VGVDSLENRVNDADFQKMMFDFVGDTRESFGKLTAEVSAVKETTASINAHLASLNGKVAEHEKRFTDVAISSMQHELKCPAQQIMGDLRPKLSSLEQDVESAKKSLVALTSSSDTAKGIVKGATWTARAFWLIGVSVATVIGGMAVKFLPAVTSLSGK
jgi:archaellum component FlaC